VFNQMSIMLGV